MTRPQRMRGRPLPREASVVEFKEGDRVGTMSELKNAPLDGNKEW